jgi:hypothetical protein
LISSNDNINSLINKLNIDTEEVLKADGVEIVGFGEGLGPRVH